MAMSDADMAPVKADSPTMGLEDAAGLASHVPNGSRGYIWTAKVR
jgi:hypothetical protein